MSGLQITVTTAGRAAIVNAENTGTAPVRIAQIGITAQAFTPNAGMTALPGEIKRLTTFAGAAVADDTVHVTVRDDSADVYTMRGFALYLENGTLFALYGQAGAILEKSAQAMMLLAADIRFVQVDATSLTFGDTDWINPPATTTVQGVVELADSAEAVAGADATRAMTPAATRAVLDDRLGQGAPSAFVKTLLALATAAAIRAALSLKSAALKDEGAGNGLDADLLDGQHGAYYRDWNNLTNLPATFPPSAHGHAWSQISDPPATATRWPAWTEVTEKPATFPPSAHSHAAGDITSGVFDLARIPDLPIGKITNLQNSLDQKAPVANPVFTGTAKSAGGFASDGGSISSNAPAGQSAHYWLRDETGLPRALLYWDRGSGTLRMRRYNAAGNAVEGELTLYATTCTWNGNNLWHAGNFNPDFKVSLNGNNAGFIRLTGGGNAYYLVDRTSGRDWALYAENDQLRIWNGTASVAHCTPTGAFVAAGGFTYGSSIRLKTDLAAMPYGLSAVEQIEPMAGRYREEFNADGRRRLFLIAEQLRDVIPEAVFEEGIDFQGERCATVDYMQLVPVLIKAVQELAAQVRGLQASVRGA